MISDFEAPPANFVLESDSCKRADLVALANKEWDKAEASKHELEELQRHDKKQRGVAEESRKLRDGAADDDGDDY